MTSRVNDKNGAFSAHALLKDVSQKGELFIDNEEVEGSRRALLTSARALVASLESPAETLGRMNWFEVRTARDIREKPSACIIVSNKILDWPLGRDSHRNRLKAVREDL